MLNPKHHLNIELGHTAETSLRQLQLIKDAMAQAILLKIEATGITDPLDGSFPVWQAIYLEADNQATQLLLRP